MKSLNELISEKENGCLFSICASHDSQPFRKMQKNAAGRVHHYTISVQKSQNAAP